MESSAQNLQALVVCSDDKIIRALRRVLSDLEIAVEFCSDADSAVNKLTRRRFESVIVDCAEPDTAAKVFASVRSALCNKRSIAVALIDRQKAVRTAFELGAHFVLYKPISAERAQNSFRAARALMKCERRRNARVPVEIPVALTGDRGTPQRKAISCDLGLGGMALKLSRRALSAGALHVKFELPGAEFSIECAAEIAWDGGGSQAGIRFVNLSTAQRDHLKSWLGRHSPAMEPDDPPAPCKLTDLSLGACYVEMPTPFPVNTRVSLSIRLAKFESQAQGVVRVMHPEVGMGVEFTRTTDPQSIQLEKFIHNLKTSKLQPQVVVEPEGMNESELTESEMQAWAESEDPLLQLFQKSTDLTAASFLNVLRSQRESTTLKAHAAAASV
jgi:CheY-like chemotaxis protein